MQSAKEIFELGEPLVSSLGTKGSPDFRKLLSRKKIEMDTYFEPGQYFNDRPTAMRGVLPWSIKKSTGNKKTVHVAPVMLSQITMMMN